MFLDLRNERYWKIIFSEARANFFSTERKPRVLCNDNRTTKIFIFSEAVFNPQASYQHMRGRDNEMKPQKLKFT